MIAPKVFTVGQINRYIKNLLENDFILNSLLVQGEISNFKAHSSGHWYFTLKDATGALSCMIFRQDAEEIPFLPENGMQVILYGRVSLYERTGQYQLYGEFMEPVGMGALQMAFEQMKEKLAAEGLFDADFKREMPAHAKCIAVVTSPVGAAVRDVIQIVKRRDPRVKIAVFPTLVQGEKAAEDIVRSLRLANEWGGADVIILGRGGGSMEDLWPFNEEKVARAIFASEIPVISAVGHETDFTITDFVSDLRAPTPSAAAELATAIPLESRIAMLEGMQERLWRDVSAAMVSSRRRLEFLKERPVLKRPLEKLHQLRVDVEGQSRAMQRETMQRLEKNAGRLAAAQARLESVSPFSVMKRGYAMILNEAGQPLTAAADAREGQKLQIEMRDGRLYAAVTGKAVIDDGKEKTVL
ncbi:MAG: exodeoxyribonuclease VII large subunit [Anaerotignum sp.]|nr:exodeoxyribonuclease VII large subunit [Anaerotignum sp.]